jgi:hypothetical protein
VINVATGKEGMNMLRMRMGWCRGIMTLSILLCGLVAPATAQVLLYDDFSGGLIDPERWIPSVSVAGNIYEMGRLILGEELLQFLMVNGGNRSDIGGAFGRHELRFARTDFTALVFEATVQTYLVTGCPTPGSQASVVFVDAPLTLFNDGTTTAPNDQTGDIAARIEIFRSSDSTDPPELLQTLGQLTRCADPTCATRETIGVVSLGPVALGQRNTYTFFWDAFSRFVAFWKNAEPPQIIPYSQNIAFRRSFRSLGVAGLAANCTAAPRPSALVLATIDNVTIFVP